MVVVVPWILVVGDDDGGLVETDSLARLVLLFGEMMMRFVWTMMKRLVVGSMTTRILGCSSSQLNFFFCYSPNFRFVKIHKVSFFFFVFVCLIIIYSKIRETHRKLTQDNIIFLAHNN